MTNTNTNTNTNTTNGTTATRGTTTSTTSGSSGSTGALGPYGCPCLSPIECEPFTPQSTLFNVSWIPGNSTSGGAGGAQIQMSDYPGGCEIAGAAISGGCDHVLRIGMSCGNQGSSCQTSGGPFLTQGMSVPIFTGVQNTSSGYPLTPYADFSFWTPGGEMTATSGNITIVAISPSSLTLSYSIDAHYMVPGGPTGDTQLSGMVTGVTYCDGDWGI